jgi:hypothetical protein
MPSPPNAVSIPVSMSPLGMPLKNIPHPSPQTNKPVSLSTPSYSPNTPLIPSQPQPQSNFTYLSSNSTQSSPDIQMPVSPSPTLSPPTISSLFLASNQPEADFFRLELFRSLSLNSPSLSNTSLSAPPSLSPTSSHYLGEQFNLRTRISSMCLSPLSRQSLSMDSSFSQKPPGFLDVFLSVDLISPSNKRINLLSKPIDLNSHVETSLSNLLPNSPSSTPSSQSAPFLSPDLPPLNGALIAKSSSLSPTALSLVSSLPNYIPIGEMREFFLCGFFSEIGNHQLTLTVSFKELQISLTNQTVSQSTPSPQYFLQWVSRQFSHSFTLQVLDPFKIHTTIHTKEGYGSGNGLLKPASQSPSSSLTLSSLSTLSTTSPHLVVAEVNITSLLDRPLFINSISFDTKINHSIEQISSLPNYSQSIPSGSSDSTQSNSSLSLVEVNSLNPSLPSLSDLSSLPDSSILLNAIYPLGYYLLPKQSRNFLFRFIIGRPNNSSVPPTNPTSQSNSANSYNNSHSSITSSISDIENVFAQLQIIWYSACLDSESISIEMVRKLGSFVPTIDNKSDSNEISNKVANHSTRNIDQNMDIHTVMTNKSDNFLPISQLERGQIKSSPILIYRRDLFSHSASPTLSTHAPLSFSPSALDLRIIEAPDRVFLEVPFSLTFQFRNPFTFPISAILFLPQYRSNQSISTTFHLLGQSSYQTNILLPNEDINIRMNAIFLGIGIQKIGGMRVGVRMISKEEKESYIYRDFDSMHVIEVLKS